MTERIDLDDVETETEDEGEAGNYGDWFWRGEGSPDDEPTPPSTEDSESHGDGAGREGANAVTDREHGSGTPDREGAGQNDADDTVAETGRARIPHVPRKNDDKPVGVPQEGGGAGGTSAGAASEGGADAPRPMGSGPHGGGVDDMTMALTYAAARTLANPDRVFATAYEWCDWVGIVGDVPAHVIQKFQRDNGVDADFFNGSGTEPGERLAGVDRNSMFYAERMVVVGIEGRDEPVADAAGWEFVPLSEAASKADWDYEEPSGEQNAE